MPSQTESYHPAGSLSDEQNEALEFETGMAATGSQEIDDRVAAQQTSDSGSLIAKITPATPPNRAASLRLTEEGRQLVISGEYQRALERLERTIAVDSTNPYSYYYLALVHYRMENHEASINFLDVAESLLTPEPYWLAQVYALRGRNLRAQGLLEQADVNFARALRSDPNNPVAFQALTRIGGDSEQGF